MTDRELLERAAKAAGIEYGDKRAAGRSPALYLGQSGWWNPLADDGDALRLSVLLGLTLWNEHESAGVAYCTRGAWGEEFEEVPSGKPGDPPGITPEDYAATRRAIVLAAAEMAP